MRYIWNVFGVTEKQVNIHTWSEIETESGSIQPKLPLSYYGKDDIQKILVSSEFIEDLSSPNYIEVNAEEYYGIKGGDGLNPTYISHPFVVHRFMPDDNSKVGNFIMVGYHIQSAKYDKANNTISLSYRYRLTNYDVEYIESSTPIEMVSSKELSTYPLDGYRENDGPIYKSKKYKFIGADAIDIIEISYNEKTINPHGSVICATISDKSAKEFDTDVLYNWRYSIDGGKTWTIHATAIANTSYLFDVPPSCSGFIVQVQVVDGIGYESDWISGETLYVMNIEPPSPPTSITIPDIIYKNIPYCITWDGAEGNSPFFSQYLLELSIDGGDFREIYTGVGNKYTDIRYNINETIQYRISVFNKYGKSEQIYTPKISPVNPFPPEISGKDENIGAISYLEKPYTVTKVMDDDVVTVAEYLDDSLIRTIDNYKSGETTLVTLSKECIESFGDGTHVLKIYAFGTYNNTSVRTWTFQKIGNKISPISLMSAAKAIPVIQSISGEEELYKLYQKQEDGTYRLIRYENVSNNVYHRGRLLSVLLDSYLPEVRSTSSMPSNVPKGKIIIGSGKVWVGGANGTVIELQKQKGGHVAQSTPPTDTSLLWIDTSDSANPLIRFYSGGTWKYVKSVYSGGAKG